MSVGPFHCVPKIHGVGLLVIRQFVSLGYARRYVIGSAKVEDEKHFSGQLISWIGVAEILDWKVYRATVSSDLAQGNSYQNIVRQPIRDMWKVSSLYQLSKHRSLVELTDLVTGESLIIWKVILGLAFDRQLHKRFHSFPGYLRCGFFYGSTIE